MQARVKESDSRTGHVHENDGEMSVSDLNLRSEVQKCWQNVRVYACTLVTSCHHISHVIYIPYITCNIHCTWYVLYSIHCTLCIRARNDGEMSVSDINLCSHARTHIFWKVSGRAYLLYEVPVGRRLRMSTSTHTYSHTNTHTNTQKHTHTHTHTHARARAHTQSCT